MASLPWVVYAEKASRASEIVYEAACRYAVTPPELVIGGRVPEKVNLIHVGPHPAVLPPENGVAIRSLASADGLQTIVVTGDGEAMLLYAAVEFYGRYIPYAREAHRHGPDVYYFRPLFEGEMPPYRYEARPRFENRGIWTWGHVIYNYKKLIDRMVFLKLNTLTVWNDHAPLNAGDVVAYAHENGVKIIWGFSWGWDTSTDAHDVADLERLSDSIVAVYREEYASAGGDGIYFQSFTETNEEKIGDILIADAVTRLVNRTAGRILSLSPGLHIQMGLHATSVKKKLAYIGKVDPRVSIVWEDCGAFPFHYMPGNIEGFEETEAFTDEIHSLRDGGFGAVLKGLICLDWGKFRHLPAAISIGTASAEKLEEVAEAKREIWRYVQTRWIRNARYAHRMLGHFGRSDELAFLLEDGALEHDIFFPAALAAEMLWSDRPVEELLTDVGSMPYVDFA